MSENESKPGSGEHDIESLLTKPTELEPQAPAPEVAVKQAAFAEVATAATTPMKDFVDHATEILRTLTEKEQDRGFISVFLGNTKASQERANVLMGLWLSKTALIGMVKSGDATTSMQASAKANWDQHITEHYPEKSSAEMDVVAQRLYEFVTQYQDNIKIRSAVMNEEGITNRSNRGSGIFTSDVMGKRPSRSIKGFTVSEMMRRTSIRAEKGDFQFDLLLRNSYSSLTFVRPNKLELADLVNEINRTVKGYVRTVGGNSLTLSYVAAARVVWNFVATRIVGCSVTGLIDFADLARIIRITDVGPICIALMKATHSEGVNFDLHCLAKDCGWNEFALIDPDNMLKVRKSIETPEDSAIFGNLFNGKAKYSVEETLAMIEASTYGMAENRVYNEDSSVYLEIGPPSLAEAFETFDYYAGRVNPELANIRSKVIDQKEYESQVALHLTTLGSTEFLHWIKTYVNVATPNTDEEDIIFKRSECDAGEFNKGLMETILDSKVLNKTFSAFVMNKTPFMSHTFVGVRNYACPKCKANSGHHQPDDRQMGYTPIEPLMAFFTLTQLLLMSHAAEAAEATNEAISR